MSEQSAERDVPTAAQIRAAVSSGICAWCGRGPFKLLAGHVAQKHAIGTRRLRDLAGFTYTEPICSPEVSTQRTKENRESRRAERMNAEGVNGARSPKHISAAGKAKTREALAKVARDPQQTKAAAAKGRPAAIAATKRRARLKRLNAQHGTLQSYKFGCRCADCREANRAASQAWRDKAKATGMTTEPTP